MSLIVVECESHSWRYTPDRGVEQELELNMWTRDIPLERQFGLTRCCVAAVGSRTLAEVLAMFGMAPTPENLVEVNAEEAQEILTLVLSYDLAYRSKAMPRARASELSGEFVSSQPAGVRYYTNGKWSDYFTPLEAKAAHFAFSDFTESTFDAGVVAVGAGVAACVWVEDED